jgi:DNA-binding response OmpR family regulator
LESTLLSWKYEVCEANNGAEALHILEDRPRPAIALLDWMMPGIEGPEICRIVRARPRTVPVDLVLLTSLASREDIIQGLEAGADDFLTKPFELPRRRRVMLKIGKWTRDTV